MRNVFLLLIIMLLSGCSRTDPRPAFCDVQREIKQRAGQSITWNRFCCEKHLIESRLHDNLSVDEVIQITLFNNPHLQAIYENLGIAQAAVVQSGLFKNPVFDGALRYDGGFGSPYMVEMSLLQNFIDILLKPLKKKMACSDLQAVKNQVTTEVLNTIRQCKMDFYTVQVEEVNLELEKKIFAAKEASFEFMSQLFEAGNITSLSLSLSRFLVEQEKINVLAAELAVIEAKESLNRLMGLCHDPVGWNVTLEFETPTLTLDSSAIESAIVSSSLDLQVLREKIRSKAAQLSIVVNEKQFQDLSVGVDSERESDGNWFVGPAISMGIPLFDYGQANQAANRSEIFQLIDEYQAMTIEIRSGVRVAYQKCLSTLKRYDYANNEMVPLAKRITHESLLQCNAMQIGAVDLLMAKQQELETEMQTNRLYLDYQKAFSELEQFLSGSRPYE